MSGSPIAGGHAARRLTIGMFADTYLPETNGVVTSVVAFAAALRRRGHRVIIVAPSHGDDDETNPDVFFLRSTSFPFYPQFRMAFPLPAKILAMLPQLPFDIVHAHSFFFIGCLGAYLGRLRKVPLFFTYHTRFSEYAHYLPVHQRVTKSQAVWLSREFSNRCDRVITPTKETAELLRGYGVDKPVDVIPSGVDLHGFDREGPTPPAILAARPGPALLYVGRLGKEKNLDLVFDAVETVLQERPDAHFIVVGDGPYRSELEQRCRRKPLASHVHFVGELPQRELGPYYRDADAFVFGSTTETQGLVLLEALAHDLPVAAVDCPVTREAVGELAGILTEETSSALASACLELLNESPERRARRRLDARSAAEQFSVDHLATQLERLYLQAGDLATVQ